MRNLCQNWLNIFFGFIVEHWTNKNKIFKNKRYVFLNKPYLLQPCLVLLFRLSVDKKGVYLLNVDLSCKESRSVHLFWFLWEVNHFVYFLTLEYLNEFVLLNILTITFVPQSISFQVILYWKYRTQIINSSLNILYE